MRAPWETSCRWGPRSGKWYRQSHRRTYCRLRNSAIHKAKSCCFRQHRCNCRIQSTTSARETPSFIISPSTWPAYKPCVIDQLCLPGLLKARRSRPRKSACSVSRLCQFRLDGVDSAVNSCAACCTRKVSFSPPGVSGIEVVFHKIVRRIGEHLWIPRRRIAGVH